MLLDGLHTRDGAR